MSGEFDVVFGAGALGRAIAREAVSRGRKVRIVSRRGGRAPEGAEAHAADVTDPAAVRKVCEGARNVFHTATPDYTQWQKLYPPIQRGILEGLAGTGARLVSAESVYMYGPVEVPMTEDLPHVAKTRKGRVRAERGHARDDVVLPGDHDRQRGATGSAVVNVTVRTVQKR